MNFFNKYKELFGVSDSTPLPKSKLSINNNLFIDKPFVPTYQQTLSINSKLKDLRKDYNELEQEIQSINTVMRNPRRISSRKGKQIQQNREKDKYFNNSNIQSNAPIPSSPNNTNNNSPFLKHHKLLASNSQNRMQNVKPYDKLSSSQQIKDPFVKKRMTWLKDEQVNLAKHSQMNYVFNHKIQSQNQKYKQISQSPRPKAQNFMFGSAQNNISGLKNQGRQEGFRPANRNRPQLQSNVQIKSGLKGRDAQKGQADYNGAVRRRQQAKKNIISRRQKLGYLLRTSW